MACLLNLENMNHMEAAAIWNLEYSRITGNNVKNNAGINIKIFELGGSFCIRIFTFNLYSFYISFTFVSTSSLHHLYIFFTFFLHYFYMVFMSNM
jgi:hypothetical protein